MNFYTINGGLHVSADNKRKVASFSDRMSLRQALDFADTVRQMALRGQGIIYAGEMSPVDQALLAEHFADIERERTANRGEGKAKCPYCGITNVEAVGAKTCISLICVDKHAREMLASGKWGNRKPRQCPECDLWFQPTGSKHLRHSGACATKHDIRVHRARMAK